MRTAAVKFIFILLCCCMAVSLCASATRAEETGTVEGRFFDHDMVVSIDYAYSDDFFLKPSDRYDHDFARLSMGLSAAAFRDDKTPDAEDHFLIEFLENMGFSRIESDTYRTEPTADSIAYGLASKKIGDMTVLVCAVCGGGYGMEWASNLTVGDEELSQGFREASEKVMFAVDDYMERNIRDEKVKLWIAGYSRAAAVSNITAAKYTDSGRFEDVYAYTFATPRTTRNPIAYPNIFNIINKEDMVPKIPLADWGYERYGQDLLIVSPETDSNCAKILERAEAIYQDMLSCQMVENPEINYQLRILFDYLLMLMPDSATYTEYLQPVLVDAITQNGGMQDALKVLLSALRQYRTNDPTSAQELSSLVDYLVTMIATYYHPDYVKTLPADLWDPQLGSLNLFNAHLAPKYLAFLFASDDPSELYTKNTEYIRLIIYGNVDSSISTEGTVIKNILADGTELIDGKEAPYSFPDSVTYEEKTVITLPSDKVYEVSMTSWSDLLQAVSYTGLLFSGETMRAQADNLYTYIMSKGETAVIQTSVNGKAIEPSGSDHTDISVFTEAIYSPTTAMRMENNRIIHLNISGFINTLILLGVLLLIQLGVSIGLAIRRKRKHLKRNVILTLVWHSAMAFPLIVLEIGLWYFIPFLPLLKTLISFAVYIVIFVYAFKGCREQNPDWKLFWKFILALTAFMVFKTLLFGEFDAWKAILLFVAYGAFMAAAYWLLWHGRTRRQVICPT